MDLHPACLLRIYLSEGDRLEGRPACDAVLESALAAGLAGATALHGVAGFGNHHRLHTAHLLRLAEQLPLVVEIVDEAARLETFAARLAERLPQTLFTLEQVRSSRSFVTA